MSVRHWAVLFLGLGIVPLVGCGAEKSAEVTGTVTLKNQPLVIGVVTFFPDNGPPVATFVQNGSYTIPAVVYGTHRVAVTPYVEAPEVTPAGGAGRPLKPGEVDPTVKAAPAKKPAGPVIPEKYRSVDTSELKCQVDQPKVTYPIALD